MVTFAGGNLFKIAALYYGDAMGWNLIARANGLIDPVFTGILTLVIPEYSKKAIANG